MSRIIQPDSNDPSQIGNRLNNVRNWYTDRTYLPLFEFDHAAQIGNARKVNLTGQWLGGQSQSIIVPIRLENSFDQLEITDDWTLDLDTATINQTTFTGGLVDGLPVVPDSDFLIWAFYDESESPASRFKGFGVTTSPSTPSLSRTGGGLGATCTFTVNAGHGWRYNVGARIIARASSTRGTEYNQGVITAVAESTITATMDATYGAISETNTALTGSVYTIIQTNHYAPRMYYDDSVYPGSGVEYQYAYIGHLHTDTASNIQLSRYRGDLHPIVKVLIFYQTGISASTNYTVCLMRWIPMGAKSTYLDLGCSRSAGGYAQAYGEIHTDYTGLMKQQTSTVPAIGAYAITTAIIPPRSRDGSVYISAFTSPGTTILVQCEILGYVESNH